MTARPATSKATLFAEIRQKATQLTDALGNSIDPGILDTVVALRLYGVNTIASCEGHNDRITGGPYVMFESAKATEYEAKYKKLQDKSSILYKQLYHKAAAANAREVQTVLNLLDAFYESKSTPHSQRLIVRCFGASAGKLMCHNADSAYILGVQEQKNLLTKNQKEMEVFTAYLLEAWRRL